jgi:hypothetical protein
MKDESKTRGIGLHLIGIGFGFILHPSSLILSLTLSVHPFDDNRESKPYRRQMFS